MTHEELLTHIIHWRRDLHAIPEMGNSEWETSAYIERAVGETRPDSACTLAGTGKKFVYRCGRAGAPALAFRADMDGLPVTENSIYPYPSRHAGMMHACGHDGHMSALLALAHIAGRMRDEGRLEVDVVLLFQRAEETTGGAARMIEEGALEDPHVCAVFGFHLMPQVDAGTIALSPGGVMAANTEFDLTFRGTRAHGAMPNLGADAAAAVAQAYLALQTFMTRAVPPTEPAVLTFGHMAAGNLRNIVADQQTVVRGMENDANKALARLEELTAQRDKAEAALEEIKKSLADNAFETAAQVHRAIAQMADAEGKLKSAEKELSKMVSHSQMMENRYKEVRTKAAKARDEYTRLKAGYDKEFEKQTARLEELKQERADAAQGIDEAYMERYKAIRSQRFPVLASLRNDQCSGCNMSLPSAVAKQLQGSDEIVECENCGRILYIPDAAQEAE